VAIDRERVLSAAQKYVEKKKYDRAVVEYQKVIQEDPNDARTLLKVGDLQSKMEAYADAVGTYERVGKFYASQGFALKAIAVYKQIREIIAKHVPQLEDKYAHITPKLAELYQQLGLTSDALAALDEVATRLQRQNRDPEAIQVFRKIVELDPTNPLPHLRLAEALSRVKDTDGAVREFGIAATQLAKLGRRDDALKVLERLLHNKPDPVHARMAAELFLARNGPSDGMQALAKLQVCFQANPRDLDTLALLAKAFNQIGQAAKAIEVHKEMARIARDAGKADVFRDLLTKLQKLAPNDEGVRRLASTVPPHPGGPLAQGGPFYGTSAPPPPASAPARPAAASAHDAAAEEMDDSYEDIGDSEISDVEPEEEPLELSRRSRQPADDGDVVIESSFEVVEEIGEQLVDAPAKEQIARILGDAASFRRSRFYAKAIETLQIGLEIAPRSVEVHQALRDTLLDAGQTEDAVQVMLDIAGLQIDNLDGEAAAQTLQDLMQIDPYNARAMEMLRELGYELVDEGAGASASQADQLPPMRPELQSVSSYDPEAPLPSYDLEEIGPEDVALRSYSEPGIRAVQPAAPAQARSSIEDIDDPFGDAPLPAYPLEPPAESAAAFDLVHPPVDATDQYASQPDVQPAAAVQGAPDIEQALEEAEFFTSRGLFDDARTILQEQLARAPNHPLLLERLAEIDAHEGVVQNGSGTRPSPSAGGDRSFDIAESLGALDGDRASGVGPGVAFVAPQEQVDVEEVFAKFKEGVAKQIGADDAQSHYDLGVAYKEMGLIDDAVREFDTAARDPKRACICHSMIGMIQLERGNLNEAIDAFMRGLHAPERTKDQEAALSYEIAAAYEVKKMLKQALDYFQRAARAHPNFRDVQERIRKLQKGDTKPPVRAVAVGADDDFDRAFDDILGGGKLP
jgi:tetratricopeptide (TPR) repeat protein